MSENPTPHSSRNINLFHTYPVSDEDVEIFCFIFYHGGVNCRPSRVDKTTFTICRLRLYDVRVLGDPSLAVPSCRTIDDIVVRRTVSSTYGMSRGLPVLVHRVVDVLEFSYGDLFFFRTGRTGSYRTSIEQY